MSSGAIRGVILVLAIVVGAVVLANGFPDGGAPVSANGGNGNGNGNHASPSPSGTTTSPTPKKSENPNTGPSPKAQGVILAIYNTTPIAGLAACTADALTKKGYVIPKGDEQHVFVGDAPASATTIIFFRDTQGRADAKLLNESFFGGTANLQKLSPKADVPGKAELAIYLGADFGNSHESDCQAA